MAITIMAGPSQAPHYVSCIDGHIVVSYDQCPPVPRHRNDQNAPVGGGGHGLLGGLLGGIL